jgi:hypothetical protein
LADKEGLTMSELLKLIKNLWIVHSTENK